MRNTGYKHGYAGRSKSPQGLFLLDSFLKAAVDIEYNLV